MQNQDTLGRAADVREHTKSGRGTLWTARILTGLLAAIWVFFGINWLGQGQDIRDAMIHLQYPMYIAPVIGITHILGGVGMVIPSRPRLTEWVYAGLTCDLLLATVSHVLSHDTIQNALHPIVLIALLAASYVLRRRVGSHRWSTA